MPTFAARWYKLEYGSEKDKLSKDQRFLRLCSDRVVERMTTFSMVSAEELKAEKARRKRENLTIDEPEEELFGDLDK